MAIITSLDGSPGVSRLHSNSTLLPRRRMLGWCAAAACVPLLPASVGAAATTGGRKLSFYNIHTSEALSALYWEDGVYLTDSLREIDYVLRDFRAEEVHAIDPHLLDLIHRLQATMDYGKPLHVISGYRTAATNAMLARRSRGVAKNSYHIKGMAIDIRLPGRQLQDLRQAALSLNGGGVGYYTRSDFVHMDTGPVRSW
jgi:uncharacterized protein YcbK (DUF882 family)